MWQVIPSDSGAGSSSAMPNANRDFSGTLVGALLATSGFAADVPDALSVNPIQYPSGSGTLNVRFTLFVDVNTFVASTTRFEIFRDNVATGQFIDVLAGVTGLQPVLNAALAFVAGQRFDLKVSNPGGAAENGKIISFGATVELF